jgi:hypothetical protein
VHESRLRLRPHLRRHRMRLALEKQAEVLRDLGAFQQNAGTAPGPEDLQEDSGATPGFRALGLARTLFRRAAETRGRGPLQENSGTHPLAQDGVALRPACDGHHTRSLRVLLPLTVSE